MSAGLKPRMGAQAGQRAGVAARAAAPGGPGGHHRFSVDDRVRQMTEHLNLTAEQQSKARAILEESKGKMDALAAQMKSLHEKIDQDIQAILTDEQKKKFAD